MMNIIGIGKIKNQKESVRPQLITVNNKSYMVIDKFMYSSSDYLGEGSFGKVYRGYSVPGVENIEMEAAIKTFELPEKQVEDFNEYEKQTVDSIRKEIVTLKMVTHNNIVRLYDVKKLGNIIFLIMELCEGGTLVKYFKDHPETTELEIRYFFSQILNGFKYLRKRNIVHRDVKPENILLKNGVLKIADFGFAVQVDKGNEMHSYMGTRVTVAPQVIMGCGYNDRCDIWSLGATLFYMCFRDYPFKGNYQSEVKLVEIMKKDCIEFPKNSSHISQYLKQVIVLMMRFKEDDRIKWEDLFNHPLFQQNLMIEVGLNVFDIENDNENEQLKSGSQILEEVDREFQLHVVDIPNEKLKIVEAQLDEHLVKIDIKKKCDKIQSQLINRITFEKGKVNFLKQLAKKLQDFEHILSGRIVFDNTKVEIADHLKALRFGINKYELIILTAIVEWMSTEKVNGQTTTNYPNGNQTNPIGIPEEDWQVFLNQSTDREKIQRTLRKDIEIEKQFVFAVSHKALSQIISMKSTAIGKVKIEQSFLDTDFSCKTEFFVTLYNLCISLSKLLYPDILRIKNNLELIHKILPTLVLIDDLFILMSLEHIFVYSEETPVNYNVFNDARRKTYNEDPNTYNILFQRVMRTYEVFFE